MKKLLILMTLVAAMTACKSAGENPLLNSFALPFGAPPFDRIKTEHFEPAFDEAIRQSRMEVDAIINNPEAPTFRNTIEALEYVGETLDRIIGVFYNLLSLETNDEMERIALEVQPKLTEYSNDIRLNPILFARVKAVYDERANLNLTTEQTALLDKTYKGFARNGAALNEQQKEEYRAITTELGSLSLRFDQNVLAATNAFTIVIPPSDSAKVNYMPSFVIEGMAQEAKDANVEGWMVTLQAPSYFPFLTYSKERELKERLWKAYNSRALGGESDNTAIVKRTVELRLRLANLLGYETFADYVLEERMAGSAVAVNDFLAELLDATKSYALKDVENISAFAKGQGLEGELMPWDWGYYNEKYKDATFDLNEEQIKPYLELGSVINGVFMLADRLFGLTFRENNELPVYHPDVRTYEVYDENNRFMALIYMDFFPRKGKRGGAWMSSFRDQYTTPDGLEVRPILILSCNFTKPTETTPALLTFREFETLLHEFGHEFHGLFAEGSYKSLTGTSVYRDFVELPSQLMENWATEKEFLDLWAKHYQTGEKMPDELIRKIIDTKTYLAGYLTVRQLQFGLSDMAWHSVTSPVSEDVTAFEKRATEPTQVLPYIAGTSFSTSFSHIFSGGYAAGYYSYKWAEVLEADAFSLFIEKGIFDRDVAASFRNNILSKGGTENPMDLYVRFRGRRPDPRALLVKMGVR